MVTLNDYLYSGDTVLRILHKYVNDLHNSALETHNQVDLMHCNFLIQFIELLEHNEFLTAQSNRILEIYDYMAKAFPYLAFTFKGRIKSLIRAEEKFNGNIVEYVYDFYKDHGMYPPVDLICNRLNCFRDLIAYRIVISVPRCHLNPGEDVREVEKKHLYEVANILPELLRGHELHPEISGIRSAKHSSYLHEDVSCYYRDYVENPSPFGYQSLHITFYDNSARNYLEIQLRTKEMDDFAEIGPANHLGYEKRQKADRVRRDEIPIGECVYFDEAFERGLKLQQLNLADLDVNMFGAVNNSLINDGCGLYRGRLILPFEHLSRFQNGNVR